MGVEEGQDGQWTPRGQPKAVPGGPQGVHMVGQGAQMVGQGAQMIGQVPPLLSPRREPGRPGRKVQRTPHDLPAIFRSIHHSIPHFFHP